jgi:acetyl-CoA carboxylase biotin carboxyl carrier protein
MAADEANSKPGPFDVQTIRSLVALMSRHDLAEIDLRHGDQRIRLRRGGAAGAAAPVIMPAPSAVVPPPAAPGAAPAAPAPAEKPGKPPHVIKSPLVGTFYSSPTPGAEPFVRVGARVTPATVVGLVEAMKLFNEIPAECTGVISEILVENQQAVEFGQPLFKVDLA